MEDSLLDGERLVISFCGLRPLISLAGLRPRPPPPPPSSCFSFSSTSTFTASPFTAWGEGRGVLQTYCRKRISVADPDPGSGAFLTPGSRIGFFPDPDLGSRIPNPYFWELSDNFLGKKFYDSLKIGPSFFLQHFKNKYVVFNFVKFIASKKRYDKKFFFHPCLSLVFWYPGSEIRDG